MNSRWKRLLGASSALAATVAMAGCSGGDASGDDAVRLALVANVAGESAHTTDYYNQGVELAVEEINAAGGIDGRKIDLKRFAPDAADPSKTVQAVQKATQFDPAVMIGFEATSMVRASLTQIAQSGKPFLTLTSGSLSAEEIETGGGRIFQPIPSSESGNMIESIADFAVEHLHGKRVGILYVDASVGVNARETAVKQIESHGGEVVVERDYAVTDTDLTAQVLAIKKADPDVLLHLGYPQQIAIQVEQFKQNDYHVETVGNASSIMASGNGYAALELFKDHYGATYCNPVVDQPEWSATFEEKFGKLPDPTAALAYDMVFLTKAAVEQAGSTDADAVTEALASLSYTDGICEPEYKSSGENNLLSDQVVMVDVSVNPAQTVAW